jgi:uncharacterized damage-inducible protein DinB
MKVKWLFASLFLLAGCAMSWAQAGKPAEHPTVTQILDGSLTNVESAFVPAAEAMPEDKYSFAPTGGEFKGVRTFAQQIKHVAAVNYLLGGGILQEKPPADTGEENGPASVSSKADIVKYLKDSFAYLHQAVKSIDEKNEAAAVKSPFGDGQASRLGLAVGAISHPNDHYGQMVVYLRLNGIVPPASR